MAWTLTCGDCGSKVRVHCGVVEYERSEAVRGVGCARCTGTVGPALRALLWKDERKRTDRT